MPTFVYAAIVLVLNFAKTLTGPYFFLEVYENPWYMSIVWVVVVLGMAALLSWLLLLINRAIGKLVHYAGAFGPAAGRRAAR